MSASSTMRPGDRIFFIYDRSVVKKEEDDPKDAIVYFYPQSTTIDVQCVFCCQLVGMYALTKTIAGSAPKLFKLRRSKVATVHEGNFTLGLACKLRTPDSAIIRKLDNLYRVFAFYHCSITHVQQISGTKEAFLSNMNAIWDFYVPYVRRYGNTVPAIFEPIQSVRLLKGGNCLFLRCSHLLQWLKSRTSLLAGCILYKRSVLCTQLTPELTSHLLLIKPNQHHHPSQSVTDTVLPFGVRIMSVYVTRQQYRQIMSSPQASSTSNCSAQPEAPDAFHTPPISLMERQDTTSHETPWKPKRKLSSKAGKFLSNFTGILDGTVWSTAARCETANSRSESSRRDQNRVGQKERSTSSMKDVNEVVLSKSSDDIVAALQRDEGFPESTLSGIAYQECQSLSDPSDLMESHYLQRSLGIHDRSETQSTSFTTSKQDETQLNGDAVSPLEERLEHYVKVKTILSADTSHSDLNMNCKIRTLSRSKEDSVETGLIQRCLNGHQGEDLLVPTHQGIEQDETTEEEGLSHSGAGLGETSKGSMRREESCTVGSTERSTSSCGIVNGEIEHSTSEGNTNHVDTLSREYPLHNNIVQLQGTCNECSNAIAGRMDPSKPDLLRNGSDDEHQENPDLLQSSRIKDSARSVEQGQQSVEDVNVKGDLFETPSLADPACVIEDAISRVSLKEESEGSNRMSDKDKTDSDSESQNHEEDEEKEIEGLSVSDTEDGYHHEETKSPNFRGGDCQFSPPMPSSEQSKSHCSVASSEEMHGSEDSKHRTITDGDGSVGSLESDKTLNSATLSPRIESREEGGEEEGEESREELRKTKEDEETSGDDGIGLRQDLQSQVSAILKESEPVLEDLVNVSLYVQAHSDTTLLFLADKSIMQEKNMLNQLWQSVLKELGELELQLKDVVRPDRIMDSKGAYNFIHFDNHNQTLEGSIVNPVNQAESFFCRSSQFMHNQFLSDETLTDITLRNHQTVVCAHQNACHHTFYQRNCKTNPSVGIPSRDDPEFYIQNRCKDALKDQNINLL